MGAIWAHMNEYFCSKQEFSLFLLLVICIVIINAMGDWWALKKIICFCFFLISIPNTTHKKVWACLKYKWVFTISSWLALLTRHCKGLPPKSPFLACLSARAYSNNALGRWWVIKARSRKYIYIQKIQYYIYQTCPDGVVSRYQITANGHCFVGRLLRFNLSSDPRF